MIYFFKKLKNQNLKEQNNEEEYINMFTLDDYKILGPSLYESLVLNSMRFIYFLDNYNYEPYQELGLSCLKINVKYEMNKRKIILLITNSYNLNKYLDLSLNKGEYYIKCKLIPNYNSFTSPLIVCENGNPTFNVIFEFDFVSYEIIIKNDITIELIVNCKILGKKPYQLFFYLKLNQINFTYTNMVSTERLIVLLPKVPKFKTKQIIPIYGAFNIKSNVFKSYVCIGIRVFPKNNKMSFCIHAVAINDSTNENTGFNKYFYIIIILSNQKKRIFNKRISRVFQQDSFVSIEYYMIFDFDITYENDYNIFIGVNNNFKY